MTVKRLIFLFPFLSAVLAGTSLSAQDLVSDVDSRQSGDKILITYSLSKKADVSIYFSVNGGRTYSLVDYVSGDVGENVSPGKKTAVWDVLSEMNELSGNVIFKVEAFDRAEAKRLARQSKRSDLRNRVMVSILTGIPTSYNIDGQSLKTELTLGAMVGMVKRFGWYINGQFYYASLADKHDIDYDYDSGYTGNQMNFNSVAAGAMLKVIKNIDIYAGPAVVWGKADSIGEYTVFGLDAGICVNWALFSCSVGVTAPVVYSFNPVVNIGLGFYF